MPSTSSRAAQWRLFLWAFWAYALVTIAFTHPLVWHLSSTVPHDLGDPLLSAAVLWWNAHSLPLTKSWWDGFAFWPSTGMLAFSDHRLGESLLLASPIQWAGFSALTAYNITLMATFPLSAIAAHALAFTLTERHDASVVAGLAYGFSPYRLAHIEHLELLSAFGMPAALAALHMYARDRRARWLVAFAAALLLQALTCSYYFLFFMVMLGLWIAWFIRRGDLEMVPRILGVVLLVLIVISPVALTYRAIHHHYGLTRGFREIVELSADVSSLVTASPLVGLWGWTSGLNGPERQLFPGVTIAVLILLGAISAIRSIATVRGTSRLSLQLLAVGCVFGLVTAVAAWHGPWHLGTLLSIGVPFKPFSLAFWALVGSVATSSRARQAYRRRSVFAFYVVAAVLLLLCSLGPKPALLGHQILYEPPYAWLMRLSAFGDSVRVPARFAMPAFLALSTAAALAFARLVRAGRGTTPLVCAIAASVLADAWPAQFPLLAPPAVWSATIPTRNIAAFVELPLGEISSDVIAMYRASAIQVPTVNGYSGYEPSYYGGIRLALEEHDASVLEALASKGRLLLLIHRGSDGAGYVEWLAGSPRARLIAQDTQYTCFQVDPFPMEQVRCGASSIPVAAVWDNEGPVDRQPLTDRDQDTFWMTGTAQRPGDTLLLDLGRVVQPCSIQLSLGSHVALYPRMLSVATSEDGHSWRTSFVGQTAGRAVLAGIDKPLDARIELPLGGVAARFVRMRLLAAHRTIPWIVTELAVTASLEE